MKIDMCYIFFFFAFVQVVLGGLHTRTFVRQSPPPTSYANNNNETCPASTCLDDGDCTSVDSNMKCFYDYCGCKKGYTREGNTCRERGKKVGEGCGASDDCADVNGYCDPATDTCACSDTYKEFGGACYKGYKAPLGSSLAIGVPTLSELPFFVSELNEAFQLQFTDVDGEEDSFRFYEDNSYTSDGVDYDSLELEIVVNGAQSGGVVAPSDVDKWEVSWGEDDFVLKIFSLAPDGTKNIPPLSTNNKERLKISPEVLTLTRDGGTEDFIFYPLSLLARLESNGGMGSHCGEDNDCKMYHSVCIRSRCECESGFVEDNNYCIPAATNIGDHCSSTSHCTLPNSVCENEECACADGYYEDDSGSCSNDYKHIGDPCTGDEECSGPHTECDTTCQCKHDYHDVDGKCYKDATIGEPCSCGEQCVTPNSYCKLQNPGSEELGQCMCMPTTCEHEGVCYKGYIVYPTTTDPDNTYSGRRFTTTSKSALSFQVVPAAAAPGKFSVHLISGGDAEDFNFDYQASAAGSTGEIVYGADSQGPDPITVLDSSVNFLTHLDVDPPSSISTEAASGGPILQTSLSTGIGTFDEINVEVDVDSLSALRFCPLSDDVIPETGESGDSCQPDEGCPALDDSHCDFQQVCECDDGYINFYGECLQKVTVGSNCVTLLQCIDSFCGVAGICE